jgi:hypothetical protein
MSGVMQGVYDSEDCRVFAEAFEHGWEIFLKTRRLTVQNIGVAKGALSFAILDAAATGERNARRLAMAAVARMAKYESKFLAERSFHRGRRAS